MARSLIQSALILVLAAGSVMAAGSSSKPKSSSDASPVAQAKEAYNQGVAMRDRAWKLEQELASADEGKKAKLEQRIQKSYKAAIRSYEKAIKIQPQMHEAHGSLGYALRKTGDYETALEHYDKALQLNPTYTPALEYRAEAYLGLNQPEKAKADYTVLVGKNREHAAQLLASMENWIASRRASGAVDAATLDALATWVSQEQSSLGELAKNVKMNGKGSW